MGMLRLNIFGGMIPIQEDYLLPDGGAALAQNVWLYSGSLEGLKSARLVKTLTSSATKRVYRIPNDPYAGETFNTSTWMEFSDIDVEVLRAPVRDDSYKRYYWVGPATSPSYNTLYRISTGNSAYKLGIPQPASAPGVTAPVTPDDTIAPTVLSATVNGSLIIITFTEERRLDALNPPPISAFRVSSPTREFSITTMAIDGPNRKISLSLSELVEANEVITLSYTDPTSGNDQYAIQDEAGNDAASFTLTLGAGTGNETTDKTGPIFRDARAEGDGTILKVWFTDTNELKSDALPATSTFKVYANNAPIDVSSMSIYPPDRCVILTLAKSVGYGTTVTVSYTDPTISNDTNAIQDTIGNDAQGFSLKPVENATQDIERPQYVSGQTLYNHTNVFFDKTLSSTLPAASRFTLKVNGTPIPVLYTITYGANYIGLVSSYSHAYGDTITVSYTDDTSSAAKIYDTAGNFARSFTDKPVENLDPYVGAAYVP